MTFDEIFKDIPNPYLNPNSYHYMDKFRKRKGFIDGPFINLDRFQMCLNSVGSIATAELECMVRENSYIEFDYYIDCLQYKFIFRVMNHQYSYDDQNKKCRIDKSYYMMLPERLDIESNYNVRGGYGYCNINFKELTDFLHHHLNYHMYQLQTYVDLMDIYFDYVYHINEYKLNKETLFSTKAISRIIQIKEKEHDISDMIDGEEYYD